MRITVLVVNGSKAESPVVLTGPLRVAVRQAFGHAKLAGTLKALRMDADRLLDRVTSRWADPAHQDEPRQSWVKSDRSTVVNWWVDRDDVLAAR